MRFHCMMVGALGAVIYYRGEFSVIDIFAKKWMQLISWILFFGLGFKLIYIPAYTPKREISNKNLMSAYWLIPLFSSEEKRGRSIAHLSEF